MTTLSDDSNPTRTSLLRRLKNWDDQTGWQDFFNTYWRLIHSVALQAGLSATEAEEVVQETVISVAKAMRELKTGPVFASFKSWLLLITRRRIADQFRKRPRLARPSIRRADDTASTATANRIPDPASLDLDAVWNEEWERNLLEVAMQSVKQRVSPRQWVLFHQQSIKEWPPRKVAQKYGVSLAQVYMAKYRISGLIKKEVKALERRSI